MRFTCNGLELIDALRLVRSIRNAVTIHADCDGATVRTTSAEYSLTVQVQAVVGEASEVLLSYPIVKRLTAWKVKCDIAVYQTGSHLVLEASGAKIKVLCKQGELGTRQREHESAGIVCDGHRFRQLLRKASVVAGKCTIELRSDRLMIGNDHFCGAINVAAGCLAEGGVANLSRQAMGSLAKSIGKQVTVTMSTDSLRIRSGAIEFEIPSQESFVKTLPMPENGVRVSRRLLLAATAGPNRLIVFSAQSGMLQVQSDDGFVSRLPCEGTQRVDAGECQSQVLVRLLRKDHAEDVMLNAGGVGLVDSFYLFAT